MACNRILGTRTNGSSINTDSPAYEIDTTTTANTTYLRYEDTTAIQLLRRITESTTTKDEVTFDTWVNRASATGWRPTEG